MTVKGRWGVLCRAATLAALVVALFAAVAAPASAAPDRPVSVSGNTWRPMGGGIFSYGRPSDVQLMGDWNADGVPGPGVFRGGVWYLRNSPSSGAAQIVVGFGRASDIPVVGDWDGDGDTTIGVVRGNTWFLRNSLTAGPSDVVLSFGRAGDVPVTGDWNGDRRTGVGVVRGATWFVRNALTSGSASSTFIFGRPGDVPVTGDWDDNGTTTPGVVRGGTWFLNNVLGGGAASRSLTLGACGDAAVTTSSARTADPVPLPLRGTEWSTLPTSERVVALTIDAGGNADGVASILDTLARTGTPATFFLTGDFVQRFPTQARTIASRFPTGNHTVNHPDLTALSDAAVRSEIIGAHETIRTVAGVDPRPWFRFPFGARDARTIGIANCLSYGSVRWTVDTLGWQGTSGGRSVSVVVQRVLGSLRPGEIVLMHAGSHPTDASTLDADALGQIITAVKARGYRFVTLEEFR